MIHGFDLSSPLVCEGIVGDGCGGGRIFYVQDEKLQTFDPVTKMSMILLENVKNAQKISKSACIITIECSDQTREFDLSSL
ncbi:thiamine biosynthesis protein ThiF [Sulfurimonas sp. SWIR-19]|uniref:thiamine biosynthesis protein ThiF n=1 Tax=Sulfurimonas sp. SWIR-19 TaxID=2878390 RepID=UPI001CF17CC6|nr:thiamine biosynthesis protein ThiF [Sulfurimonas sp. SWIR-19]UCN00937.1 thiamine biosynthesis protein ThiF [Sulfurimonas sp. SWIR-19]